MSALSTDFLWRKAHLSRSTPHAKQYRRNLWCVSGNVSPGNPYDTSRFVRHVSVDGRQGHFLQREPHQREVHCDTANRSNLHPVRTRGRERFLTSKLLPARYWNTFAKAMKLSTRDQNGRNLLGWCCLCDVKNPWSLSRDQVSQKLSASVRLSRRFGSFEIFKGVDTETGRKGPSTGNNELRKQLLEYVIKVFYPQVN